MRYSPRELKIAWTLSLSNGFIAFCYVAGTSSLNPLNTNWIYHGINADPIQHFFGWLFYKNSDWSLPIGRNVTYGDYLGSSIVYSDSIPIAAIISKVVAEFTTTDFQYFGIWLLICFILQSFFAIRIAQLYTRDWMLLILVGALLICTPVFLWRIQAHFALSAHFLIIAGIYAIFKSYKRDSDESLLWVIILTLACLIHPYLLGMLLILWFGAIADSLIKKRVRRRTIVRNCILILANIVFLSTVVAGYDFTHSNSMKGTGVAYGVYRWNPASILVPYGKSLFLSGVIPQSGNFDSFSYFGLGIIFIFIVNLLLRNWRGIKFGLFLNENQFTVLSFALLILFAISNNVAIADFRFSYDIPKWTSDLFSVFSSSARFIWPVTYSFLFLMIIAVLRTRRRGFGVIVLSLCLFMQMTDLLPLREDLRLYLNNNISKDFKTLESEEIAQALESGKYSRIVVIPTSREGFGFPEVTQLAYTYGLSTNSVYLARVDGEKINLQRKKVYRELKSGNLESRSIYVLSQSQFSEIRGFLIPDAVVIQEQEFFFIFLN